MRCMSTERAKVEVEIRLPFISIRTDSVRSLLSRRRTRSAGPFMIISVTSGLALDAAFETKQGAHPHLWGPHGKPHQLWYLRPSGHNGEVTVVSASNGLLLDGGRGVGQGYNPEMWARNDQAWQRWSLKTSPDGRAHQIVCVGTGMALDSPHESEWGTWPVMWDSHEGENQQWVLAMPFVADQTS